MKIETRPTVVTKVATITKEDILAAFKLPKHTGLTIKVPGGGDWSNVEIEIGPNWAPLIATWTEVPRETLAPAEGKTTEALFEEPYTTCGLIVVSRKINGIVLPQYTAETAKDAELLANILNIHFLKLMRVRGVQL